MTVRQLYRRWGAMRLLRYAGEAALTYMAYGFFKVLPLDKASAAGGWVMRQIGPHFRRTSTTVLPQLARAFPDKTAAEHHAVMLGMWDHLGRIFAELSHMDHIDERVTLVGGDYLEASRASGRPIIFVTGHIGNWEAAAIAVSQAGIPLHVVYRATNNPWVDGLLRRTRRAGTGDRLIPKGATGAKQILSLMRSGGAVALIVDQRMTGGVEVPFFGRPAATGPAVAVFAAKYRPIVHYIRSERLGGAHFRVTISPPVDVPDTGDATADQMRFLTDINAELESWIRVHPSQWLWTHRRWEK